MANIINFYLDDSGTRHPDHDAVNAQHGRDWFALGGVLVHEEKESETRGLLSDFKNRWPNIGECPLHSVEIRHRSKNFRWLEDLDEIQHNEFMVDLTRTMTSLPVLGLACVIDRPGYNARYREMYGRQRWSLCRTAFAIAVERAAKYAEKHGARLRVLPERCSKKDDRKLLDYFTQLRTSGLPFDPMTSEKYSPMGQDGLGKILYEFKPKNKSSPMAQVADLYLWPMCMGGYDKNHRPYRALLDAARLMECRLSAEEITVLGTKYSCFDEG